MMARVMINTSNPTNEYTNCIHPSIITSLKAGTDIFINNSICGIMRGKPSIAINAADCCALAAMAAKKVKTKLKLAPPNNVMPINVPILLIGLPNSNVKSINDITLITSISKRLNASFAMMKSFAPAIE